MKSKIKVTGEVDKKLKKRAQKRVDDLFEFLEKNKIGIYIERRTRTGERLGHVTFQFGCKDSRNVQILEAPDKPEKVRRAVVLPSVYGRPVTRAERY